MNSKLLQSRPATCGKQLTRRAMLGLVGSAVAGLAIAPLHRASAATRLDGTPPAFQQVRLSNPGRTDVHDASGAWLATFTDGAETVALAGPTRTFAEPTAGHSLTTNVWVRLLPQPFAGAVDTTWLSQELTDTSLDIFGMAMQYIKGAPPVYDSGVQVAGEAAYGPLLPDGSREEASDFNDYLGVPWQYSDRTREAKPDHFRSLDCSGFMRMIWCYRASLPFTYTPDGPDVPRHSWEMLDSGPGVVVIPNAGQQVTGFSSLQAGDIVFFDAKQTDGGPRIDHVGMYLGKDTAGHYRFISSRQHEDGPTFGDAGGVSLLDGSGLYASAFRAVRRW